MTSLLTITDRSVIINANISASRAATYHKTMFDIRRSCFKPREKVCVTSL